MTFSFIYNKKLILFALVWFAGLMFQGCMCMQWDAQIQWNAQNQILMSEDSQVKLRSIQTRVYDTTDKATILRAVVATMQDLFFDIDVLDENLGVVSGKKLFNDDTGWAKHPSYYLYETDELIIFNSNYRTWGPFHYRNDLTRLTVTIRPKEKTRSVVRASLQYNIRAVESPEMYQRFFKILGNALFLSGKIS